jgi:hypothetical protein
MELTESICAAFSTTIKLANSALEEWYDHASRIPKSEQPNN